MSPKAKKEEILETENTVVSEKVIPTPTDPEWQDYVLSHLADDELMNGNPTVDGLRRIAPIVLQLEVTGTAKVIQAPNKPNGMVATVEYSIRAASAGPTRPFLFITECADASPDNCDVPYSLHPSAMAATRAEGRALRKLLKLRKLTTAEEVATPREIKSEDGTPVYIKYNQFAALNTLFKTNNLNGIKYINKYTEKYHSTKYPMTQIPFAVAKELIQHVQKWGQGKNPNDLPVPPEEVQGYDSAFESEWEV